MDETDPEVIEIPIDGILDLHTFAPGEVSSVVEEYLHACLEKGILEVRIIHGKGRGVLRRTVHAVLERHPRVIRFGLDPGPSGWGTTLVELKPS
ncbi:MAG: Smr/MutS family protein [Thermodesulfobacteriota bacterium]